MWRLIVIVVIVIIAPSISRIVHIERVIGIVARSLKVEVKVKLVGLHRRAFPLLVLLLVSTITGILGVTRALGTIARLVVPKVHVSVCLSAFIVVVCLSALLLLPQHVLSVALANLLGPRLVDEVVVLLHAVVHVHEALVVDEQLELLAVL